MDRASLPDCARGPDAHRRSVKSLNNMVPSALAHVDHLAAHGQRLAIFLDYDGTLTPIVARPELAELSDSTRQVLRELARYLPVAILSGRDLNDLRERVKIDNIVYAGSHGFDIAGPSGVHKVVAPEFVPMLDAAEKELQKELIGISRALLERKRFSIATHYRNVQESDVSKIKRAVNEVATRYPELRKIDNKKVYELQPDVDWNKGKAVIWLLERLDRQEAFSICIGDDLTDEDAFSAINGRGAGILVSDQPRLTSARYALKNPAEVERFLRGLTQSFPTQELDRCLRPDV
jgi:trehalose 6-phosphate phosphatase